jgi:hypothetical protein
LYKKLYTPILILLFALLFSACQPAELTPIIIRMTATPAPRTATSVPEPTEAPTQAAAEPTEDTSGTSSEGEAASAPTEAPAEAEVEGVEVTFNFVTPLQTIEELEPLVLKVEAFEGVLLAHGNENTITITYDPDVTDVETLMSLLQQAGRAVEETEG